MPESPDKRNPGLAFGDRLAEACRAKRSVLCVGLDPHLDLMPPQIGAAAIGAGRAEVAKLVGDFCCAIIDAVAERIPVVKPQVAFFEVLGPPGWEALERVVAHAAAADLMTIADAKRGDIGSTATAYADYHLGPSGLNADAVTVSPFMGPDTLTPYAHYFDQGKGLFALARTSNPGSDVLQLSESPPHPRDKVGEMCRSLKGSVKGNSGQRPTGLVVGATRLKEAESLRQRFPDLPFLVPGLGAQGARAEDLAVCFNSDGLGAVVNASRSVLFAYRKTDSEDWQQAARREVEALNTALNAARNATDSR